MRCCYGTIAGWCVAFAVLSYCLAAPGGKAWQTPANSSRPASPPVERLLNSGRGKRAAKQHRQALEDGRAALKLAEETQDRVGQAYAHLLIGNLLMTLFHQEFDGNLRVQAMSAFRAALNISRSQSLPPVEGETLLRMGQVAAEQAQKQDAILFFQQAADVYHRLSLERMEAVAYGELGNLFLNHGEVQNTLQNYERAQRLFQKQGDLEREIFVANNLGVLYTHTGQHEQAEAVLQRALERVLQFHSPQHSLQEQQNMLRHNLVVLRFKQGNIEQAEAELDRIPDQMLSATDRMNGQLNRAAILLKKSDLEAAERLSRSLQEQCQRMEYTAGEATALLLLGHVSLSKTQPQAALAWYRQSAARFREAHELENAATVDMNIGWAHEQMNNLPAAAAAARQSLLQREKFRASAGTLAAPKLAILETGAEEYHFLIDLLLRLKRNEEAFYWTQKIKARVLLDIQQQSRRIAAGIGFGAIPAPHEQKIPAAQTVQQTASCLPSETALLEYVWIAPSERTGKGRVVAFVVTNTSGTAHLSVHPLPPSPDALRTLAEQFVQGCSQPKGEYLAPARALANALLPPAVRARIKGKTQCLVSPDGVLWTVPFAALVMQDAFWIETQEIDYALSATSAAWLTRTRLPRRRVPPKQTLLVFANPDFGADTRPSAALQNATRPANQSVAWHAPLPATEQEANALKTLFASRATCYTQKAATKANALEIMARFRYLHFATHGVADNAVPMQSALVMAQPANRSGDFYLTAQEISRQSLAAEMVVLSSCGSAQGQIKRGEGVIGISWAFLAAGSPTTVVSLWEVNDSSTAELMTRFYERLAGKANGTPPLPKGKALRTAVLSLLQGTTSPRWKHPSYWSPFILIGDSR